ncbi:restriction endonuclease subunit S [Pontibacter mangrovi]|uniref:Type I restriction modification DNA specificity domain-containing protein n=1 Tax=Pontibacter mangrovi TaxID=2589816 RepID=A0A501W1W3_9BACT|nr:restriction endonuclease subunit S [Pontibacter mangrovi]TPE43609.1 hypothetical protein FJM65_12700 [Pontibacter mangrovi]
MELIAAENKAQVREGYKKTEVGVIPKDWDVITLGDIGDTIIGLTYKPENICKDGTLVLRSSNIQENVLTYNDNVYVNSVIPEKLRTKVGDILICVRNGSRNLIGKCAVIDSKAENESFGAFMSVYRSSSYAYVYHAFQSNIIKKQIEENLGATINQITNKVLNSFRIPYPPSSTERDLIAKTISDVDALINNLDKLITKKKAIKQGAMQQLLKSPKQGGKRLPGFEGEWVEKTLGEVAEVISGGTPKTSVSSYWADDIWWCTPTDITSCKGKYITTTEKKISKLALQNSSANLLPKGTLLLCSRATIGVVRIANVEISTNQGFKSLLCNSKVINNEFLYYLILTKRNELIEKAIGSTFLEISKKDTKNLPITVPPTLPEQEAIATILSDMDAEIENLEKKKAKYQRIKQGMMQELLTGKTRLV